MQQADRRILTASVSKKMFSLQHCVCSNGLLLPFFPCQKMRLTLTEEDIQRGSKMKELDQSRRSYIREKGFPVIEMWECYWWKLNKRSNIVKKTYPRKICLRTFTCSWLLEEKKTESCLATFNETLKCPKLWEPILLFSLQSSRHFSWQEWYWWLNENLCRQKRSTKRYTDHFSAFVLSASGVCCYKNTPFCWLSSRELFQQPCTVSSRCQKTRWWECQIKCRCRDNEAAIQ